MEGVGVPSNTTSLDAAQDPTTKRTTTSTTTAASLAGRLPVDRGFILSTVTRASGYGQES